MRTSGEKSATVPIFVLRTAAEAPGKPEYCIMGRPFVAKCPGHAQTAEPLFVFRGSMGCIKSKGKVGHRDNAWLDVHNASFNSSLATPREAFTNDNDQLKAYDSKALLAQTFDRRRTASKISNKLEGGGHRVIRRSAKAEDESDIHRNIKEEPVDVLPPGQVENSQSETTEQEINQTEYINTKTSRNKNENAIKHQESKREIIRRSLEIKVKHLHHSYDSKTCGIGLDYLKRCKQALDITMTKCGKQITYDVCTEFAQNQRHRFLTYLTLAETNATEERYKDIGPDLRICLCEFQKKVAATCLPHIQKSTKSKIASSNILLQRIGSKKVFQRESFQSYFDKCIEVSWYTQVQDPPVVLVFEPANDAEAQTLFRQYTATGVRLEFVVWPAMLLNQNGALLKKGVAQFSKISSDEIEGNKQH
ncbi:hypothetical protein MAR_023515 [Mya arenaria]|uniref:Mitochondria-eating protein C-terminal domain-containing protein n=1 Tax=Mya arenaria TaxID=6604 RepID=A0ABY7DN75_MYAAR|nr:hypothetical protein MAR_023515 [Mya arenaria]